MVINKILFYILLDNKNRPMLPRVPNQLVRILKIMIIFVSELNFFFFFVYIRLCGGALDIFEPLKSHVYRSRE